MAEAINQLREIVILERVSGAIAFGIQRQNLSKTTEFFPQGAPQLAPCFFSRLRRFLRWIPALRSPGSLARG